MSKYVKASKYEEAGIVSERSRSMIKIIMSKFEIQQQGRWNEEIKKIDKNTDDLHKNILWRLPFVHAIFFFPELMWTVVALVVFWIVGNGVFDGTFSFSTLVLFAGTLTLMDWVIDKLSRFIKNFMRDFGTIEKLWDTFDTIKVMDKYDKWSDFNYKSWNISLQNVSFSYDKSFVFQNFNLEIQGWTKTAFVGESWGGKTTLIKLLAWYIRPDNGEIEIDGQKLSEIKLTDYYKHIGYLTQDPSVFDGTIYENLVYALDTEPPQEDLERVVKLAKCEFIREFEKWLETEIGERWVRLSWWQKQRLAIAKIMLKNPNIILLDEPTSALDSFNEEQISIALHNLFKGKTVIVVAHRLQTVKQADRILLFEQGKILEEGTHDELVKLWWKYKKMLDLQSGF